MKERVRAAGSRPAENAHDSAMVEDSRRQQQRGELAGDLDPAYVLLMLFAAALAPALIPQIVRITGKSADSPGVPLGLYRPAAPHHRTLGRRVEG